MAKARFIAVSDLHLGYDLSSLNSTTKHEAFADFIAGLCDGETDRLILNGDCFEGCVPLRVGDHDTFGFPTALSQISRSFFKALTAKVRIESLVWIPGNHDYTLWQRIAAACRVQPFTNDKPGNVLLQTNGSILPGSEAFLLDLLGIASSHIHRIRVAYPNYVLGRYYPYLVFHHGHLIDDLLLGKHPSSTYALLAVSCGAPHPQVDTENDESISSIHHKTEAFIESLWTFNSKTRAAEWAFLRRGSTAASCPYFGKTVQGEPLGSDFAKYARWYASVLLADPSTPAPLGPRGNPCYLVIGHDHAGGSLNIENLYDGCAFRVLNLGGWTREGGATDIHQHALVWNYDAELPRTVCFAG